MKITETDKSDGVQRDVERPKHPFSPYNDSGTTWGRPQMGKTAGTAKSGSRVQSEDTAQSGIQSSSSSASQSSGSVVGGVVGVVKGVMPG